MTEYSNEPNAYMPLSIQHALSEMASSLHGGPPLVIVLSGPSGVGKDTIIARMRDLGLPLRYTVTVTTRAPREGEIDGVHYYFKTEAEFAAMLANNEFLEHATVYGNHSYGTLRSEITRALKEGSDTILKPDVQGAASLQKFISEAVYIFIAPASKEELVERLRNRNTETPDSLNRRLAEFDQEMRALQMFDYVVINRQGELDNTVRAILAIISAEKSRVHPRNVVL